MSTPIMKFFKSPSFVNFSILFLIAIYVGYALLPAISSLLQFTLKILSPFGLSIILYYLLRPLVRILKKRISLPLAIAIAYLVLVAVFTLLIFFIYPKIQEQIDLLRLFSGEWESQASNKKTTLLEFYSYKLHFPAEVKDELSKFILYLNSFLIDNFVYLIASLAEFFLYLAVSLFLLFYFLKDDKKIYDGFIRKISPSYLEYTKDLMAKFDETLQHFINGRIIVAAIISFLLLIVFTAIGLSYSFVLAAISFVFFIIPSIGSFLALILPLLVAFTTSLIMGLEVSVIMVLATILEGFLVTPQVMGKELYIHPITIILILLIASSLFGIFGLLFATPAYVLCKIFVVQTYHFFKKNQLKSG